jgi:hypothetical protein
MKKDGNYIIQSITFISNDNIQFRTSLEFFKHLHPNIHFVDAETLEYVVSSTTSIKILRRTHNNNTVASKYWLIFLHFLIFHYHASVAKCKIINGRILFAAHEYNNIIYLKEYTDVMEKNTYSCHCVSIMRAPAIDLPVEIASMFYIYYIIIYLNTRRTKIHHETTHDVWQYKLYRYYTPSPFVYK